MYLKFHCITFPKNSILLDTIVLLFLTTERICKQDNPKIYNPVLLMGLYKQSSAFATLLLVFVEITNILMFSSRICLSFGFLKSDT